MFIRKKCRTFVSNKNKKQMDNPIKAAEYIRRIEIKALWGKKHIVWDLFRHVNILSGVNGIGKSSIMNKMTAQLHYLQKKKEAIANNVEMPDESSLKVPDMDITFSPEDASYIPFDVIHIGDNRQHMSRLLNLYAYFNADKTSFYDWADRLFSVTDKTIIRDSHELLFLQDGERLTIDALSSGERQMLVILLTLLVQEKKPCVLFMDEPEISLHIEWQQQLLKIATEMNPNAQIILITHSPAVIMDGWMDTVTDVEDITVAKK